MVKKHIFLSYCHDNAYDAARLREDLLAGGEAVWWDKNIRPGQDWKHEIRSAMKESYAVVLCLSKELSSRVKSGVYPEILDAIAAYRQYAPRSSFLIPVRFSECEIPEIEIDDTRLLDRLQVTDLFPEADRRSRIQSILDAVRILPGHP